MSNSRDIDFQKEESVQEYINRIFIEYEFSCLKERDAGGCHLLGEFYEGVRKQLHQAVHIWQDNCIERQFPASCFKWAKSGKDDQPRVAAQPTLAYRAFSVACDKDFAPGCCYQALMDKEGYEGRPQPDANAAVQAMHKCCGMRDARCCYILSSWYMGQRGRRRRVSDAEWAATPGTVPEDMRLALEYGTRACEYGQAEACANVSRMYATGDGVPRDERLAEQYKEIAKDIIENVKDNVSVSAQG